MRQRQSAREQRGPLRQPRVTKVRWSWGRVGYERAERPSEINSGSRGRRDSQCPSELSDHRCRRRGDPREVDITRRRGDNRLIGGHQGEGGHVVAHQQAGGETAVLRDEKITAVKSTEAARRAALFHAMQACSASAPVCAAYRMRNSPVKVPGRNRSLPFSLVGVPWWSLRTRRFRRRRRHCGGQRPGERAAAGRSAAAAAQTAQKAVGMRFCREMVSRAGRCPPEKKWGLPVMCAK